MKDMLDRQLAITYMETNSVPFIEGAEYGMGVPFQGKWYYEKSMIRMIAPKITDQQIYDMETSVKAAQTEDFSGPTRDFNNVANVDTEVVATLEREKKIFKGLIFTDPATGLEVDLQEYSGEDANAIPDNQPPLPPGPVGIVTQTSTQLGIQYFGASDSDGTIQGYLIYVDRAPWDFTISNSYLISGLDPDTEYIIEVYSVDNDDLQSTFSSVCECRTLPISNVLPGGPSYLAATSVAAYGAAFSVAGGSDSDGSVVGYNFYLDGVYNSTTVGTGSANAITISGLSPLTTYSIIAKSVDDDGGESTLGMTLNFTTTFPGL